MSIQNKVKKTQKNTRTSYSTNPHSVVYSAYKNSVRSYKRVQANSPQSYHK